MPFQLTFCQQAGNQHKKNQDALFNGKAVYQWQLKNAESYLLDNDKVIFGIADGVSSHPRNHLASHYLMALLSQCKSLDSQWLRQAHGDFCVKYRLQICIKMVKMHRLYDDFSAVICEIV